MCKNTGQPGFDPTFKRPGKGHRLCNSFRTTRFLTRTRMGRSRTRLTRPVCQVCVTLYSDGTTMKGRDTYQYYNDGHEVNDLDPLAATLPCATHSQIFNAMFGRKEEEEREKKGKGKRKLFSHICLGIKREKEYKKGNKRIYFSFYCLVCKRKWKENFISFTFMPL